jgi:hypothetical protein
MAKDYTAAINEIMPLVVDGDNSTPFIISRDSAYKDWTVLYPYPAENADSFLESQKAHDPCVLMFTGRDFSKGSFAYVCDKVLLMRLFAEEQIILKSRETDTNFDNNKLDEFCDCLEDYISELSQVTVDYLTSRDNPLEWLYDEFVAALDLSKQHLADTFDGEPFDETLKSTLFAAIDERCAYEMNPDKDLIDKMREDYACRNEGDKGLYNLLKYVEQNSNAISNDTKDYLMSIDSPLSWLGEQLYDSYHKQLEIGVDVDGGMDGGELILAIEQVVEGEQMDIDYRELGVINDFASAHNTERDSNSANRGVEYIKLTDEHCLPNGKNADFTGKLVVVNANSLLPEYRSSENQLVECSHGNGARPDAIGTSVFGKELFSGKSVVYGRHQILGIANETKLPQWAKDKLGIESINPPKILTFAEQRKACANAIDSIISEVRTDGEMAGTATYDLKSALNTLNNKFGKECVAEVLAAIVSAHDYDGRYSQKNKAWAAAFDSVTIEDTQHSIRYCTVNTHPTILDGLVSKIREAAEKAKDERPDFLEKLDKHKQKSEQYNANRETPQKNKKRGDMEVD